MTIIRRIFDTKGAPTLMGVFLLLFVLEGRRQLRRRKQPRVQRLLINAVVAIPAFSLLRLLLLPVMVKVAANNRHTQFGLNYCFRAHPAVKSLLAFMILDYTNYLWHILNHKLPFLWRFHLVHHTDPDLDVSTALRFHFGELIGSVIYRSACVFFSGATPVTVLVYEIVFEAATQFHHSNWKLPVAVESGLNKAIVTPRMHGIHHSVVRDETDSNYSVIFSWWDRLHRTANLQPGRQDVVTGVPAYQDFERMTVKYLWKLPFTRPRPW